MLKRLKLTNYRQHTDAEFTFENGLVVIRGANEKGKSNLLTAMLYLWLGSRVLNEPLEDVVTYGEDVKTLRVEGSFTVNGVDYEAYRSKNGAELVYGSHRVTGQTGVTQFMERLLGAKADTVRKLMVAEQNSIRGILESEANAGALIESLSDLSLIDELVEKVQNQLPVGPTKATDMLLQNLQESLASPPVMPDDVEVKTAEGELDHAKDLWKKANAALTDYQSTADEAMQGLKQVETVKAQIATAEARKAELLQVKEPGPCMYTEEDYLAALKVENDETLRKRSQENFCVVHHMTETTWEGSEDSAKAFLAESRAELKSLVRDLSEMDSTIRVKTSMKINEGVCSFCKKDISGLPEVEQVNSGLDSEIANLQKEAACLKTKILSMEGDIKLVEEILEAHAKNTRTHLPEFWQASGGTLPMTYTWIGPEITDSQVESVPSASIRSAISKHEKLKTLYKSAQEQLAEIKVPEPIEESLIAGWKLSLEKYEELRKSEAEVVRLGSEKRAALTTAKAVHAEKMASYTKDIERYESAKKQVEDTKTLLTNMEFNNRLVTDLRSARGEIRRRLWDTVTAAISVYFSRIRQKETIITQSEDGFMQNGQSVKGLSGSAKDMLGLAIRAALLKTFIPGAPILVVDEPYAGCDAEREMAGIGTLAAMGFPQTLLVTHSELADSVADQLLQL